MKKYIITFLFFLLLLYTFTGYRQWINGNIISPDGTIYTFLANEGKYAVFGEKTFISHIRWQPRKLRHLGGNINTGVYSINHDPNLTVLYRIKFYSEWSELYIKRELSSNKYEMENISSIKFVGSGSTFPGYYRANPKYLVDTGLNNNETIIFFEYLNNNEIFDYEIRNNHRNPFNIMDRNNGFIGFLYGFFDDIPNIAIDGTIWLNNADGLYYLVMDRRMFLLNNEWLRKLGYEK
jgi:hypothetical protein